MIAPNKPEAPDVISPETDLYPNFRWDQATDPDTESDDLTYTMEIYQFEDGSPVLKNTIEDIEGTVSTVPGSWTGSEFETISGVLFEYSTALAAGSYLARIKAVDPEYNTSDDSDFTEFEIIFHSIPPEKIFIASPVFEDPTLGQARFFSPAVEALFERLKETATFNLNDSFA